jgi:hypothetical protein
MNEKSAAINDANLADPLAVKATAVHKIWFERDGDYHRTKVAPLRHTFHTHPLLQLPKLQQLAESLLASGQCKFLGAPATVASPFDLQSQSPKGQSLADVFENIEQPGSWIALYNVETNAEYQRFLWEALNTVRPLLDTQDPGTFSVGGFIFISAPPSVTPFHIDRENNLWLQIRGRKRVNVWNPDDREAVSEEAVERFIVHGDLSAVQYTQHVRARSFDAETAPGEGVYIPSTSAHMTETDTHWVQAGDGYVVSIGIVFYTQATRRAANIYALNQFLRQRGLKPTSPGQRQWLDTIKYPLAWLYVRARQFLRGYQLRAGM